jgi:hypothetical protein
MGCGCREKTLLRNASKDFFFEKKKQKTFGPLDRAVETTTDPI